MDDFIVDGKPIGDLRVVDLKTQLEKRGLSKSGQKNILAKRLRDHLALEKIQEEQAGKDPNSAPNMEMKKCGSNIVAEYLERQQLALQVAKKAAQAARAASSSSFDDTDPSQTSANESLNESMSSPKIATIVEMLPVMKDIPIANRADEGDGLNFDTNSATSIVDDSKQVKPHKEIEIFESPLNLSKGEQKTTTTTTEKGLEAKMVEEEPAAVKEPTTTTTTTTAAAAASVQKQEPVAVVMKQEIFVKSAEPVQEVSDSRSDASSPSVDERREEERSRSGSAEEKSSRSGGGSQSVDDDRSRPVAEDGDEVEISAPQNIADELLEVSNAEKVVDRKSLSKEEFLPATIPVQVDLKEKPQRKRKWGSTTVAKRTTVSISSESLKEIVGPVTASETTSTTTLDDPVQLDYDEDPIPKRIVISREDMDEEDTVDDSVPATVDKTKLQDKAERVSPPLEAALGEDGLIKEKSPSPARHPVNRIIHIRCLTRPFTQKALHDLVGKFGSFDKNEFWIDGIKSHCFIKYDKEEDATAARDKLDNAKWPSSNPHLLRVDFSNQEDLDRHRSKAKPTALSKRQEEQSASHPLVGKENQTDNGSKPKERVVREIRNDAGRRSGSISPVRDADGKLWPKTREWDKGKDWKTGQSPPNADRSGRRRSPSPSRRRIDIHAKKEEVPAKLLDDLFRKTKTMPCIYWLPLTSEQAAEKEKERKRIHEMQRAERPKYDMSDERDVRRRFDRERHYSPYRRRY